MLFLLKWLRRLFRRRRPVKTAAVPPPLPLVAPAADIVEVSKNRHERRALERARRKYDKFVTPQGPVVEKPKRATQPKPRRKKIEVVVPDAVDDAELLIVDSHHENRADRVLYKEQETYGEFNFRDTILQQLECYFTYIERMRKNDPDAYGYYREVGATILPYVATGSWDREDHTHENFKKTTPLADWFNKTRPAFGCYVYGADPETERYEKTAVSPNGKRTIWVPKMMYFRKYKMPPPEMQMITGGDIYTMTVYWDRPFDKKVKYGVPQDFGIFVSSDGKQVIALRHLVRGSRRIWSKRKHEFFRVPQAEWKISEEFEFWARQNGEDVQHLLTEIFKQSVATNETAQYSMTRVSAFKDGVAATFSINIHRSSYFFQDRDVTVTASGSRKRIFHFVRPHVRSDGTEVKAHFRGEREFMWAGYKILITIPGRDHAHIADMDVGAVDQHFQEKGVKYLDMPQVGKRLRGMIHARH